MSLFSDAESSPAYLKAAFIGFQGSGKTTTACILAVGLHQRLKAAGVYSGPVFFGDTETGAAWQKPRFDEAGIKLKLAPLRSFKDLVPMIEEVSQVNGILILDSITHFWRDLQSSYMKKKKATYLQFQDWAVLKEKWSTFTDQILNAPCHIIMCGRAGYEYDWTENERGKKELEKTGIKMKAEGETGHEPALYCLMDLQQKLNSDGDPSFTNIMTVMKDRAHGSVLQGETFHSPTFETFEPHLEALNLGGKHTPVDTEDSQEIIEATEYKSKRREKLIEEINEQFLVLCPTQSARDKRKKADIREAVFGARGPSVVTDATLDQLEAALMTLIGYEKNDDTEPVTAVKASDVPF